jgi:hypothetical protein
VTPNGRINAPFFGPTLPAETDSARSLLPEKGIKQRTSGNATKSGARGVTSLCVAAARHTNHKELLYRGRPLTRADFASRFPHVMHMSPSVSQIHMGMR